MQLVPSEQYRYCIHVGIEGSVGFTGQTFKDLNDFSNEGYQVKPEDVRGR